MPKKEAQRRKSILSIVVIAILVFQMFLFGNMIQVNKDFNDGVSSFKKNKTDFYQTLIVDVVRPQQRLSLNSIRQSWIQYLTMNEDTELLEKVDDKYVYRNEKGGYILFDKDTMIKIKTENDCYTIVSKDTKKTLIEKSRPQWNIDTVVNILNIIATPSKTFGEKGDIVAYDAYTGEVLVDNSKTTKTTKEVLQDDSRRNLLLYDNHPSNKNPEYYRGIFIEKLMSRSDTQRESQITSLFSESSKIDVLKINDFAVYPFGSLKRNFIEKVILPYESVGTEGMDMQIGILIRAQETEIYSAFKDVDSEHDRLLSELKMKSEMNTLFPMISVILSILITFLSIYVIRCSVYQYSLIVKGKSEEEK